MKCPACQSHEVHRSRARSNWEEFVSTALPFRYYRCHKCDWRALRRRRGAPSRPTQWSRVIRIVKVAVVVLFLAIVAYLVIAPYAALPMPKSRHLK